MSIETAIDADILDLIKLHKETTGRLFAYEHHVILSAINNLKNMKETLMGPSLMFGRIQCSQCGHEQRAKDYLGFCSKCGEHRPCAANRKTEAPSNNIFVAMFMPFHDGSGEAQLLGVYSTKEKAEANCYRALKTLGYYQPTKIFETVLNEGCNG